MTFLHHVIMKQNIKRQQNRLMCFLRQSLEALSCSWVKLFKFLMGWARRFLSWLTAACVKGYWDSDGGIKKYQWLLPAEVLQEISSVATKTNWFLQEKIKFTILLWWPGNLCAANWLYVYRWVKGKGCLILMNVARRCVDISHHSPVSKDQRGRHAAILWMTKWWHWNMDDRQTASIGNWV